MGFTEAVRTCLRDKYFTFQGRASRSEYWYFILFMWVTWLVLIIVFLSPGLWMGLVEAMISGGPSGTEYIVAAFVVIVSIALCIPMLTALVRRLHDCNLSGWWVLVMIVIGLIPVVGLLASIFTTIAWFVICVMKGTVGANKHGEDPLQVQKGAEVFA